MTNFIKMPGFSLLRYSLGELRENCIVLSL